MKKLAITVGVLAALGGGGWDVLGKTAATDKDVVPTQKVTKTPFVRRVTADGNLRAVKATPLSAPTDNGGWDGPVKIAWLAPDGSKVKAGDVVVRFDPSDPEKQMKEGEADLAAANAKLAGEEIKSKNAIAGRDRDA